MTTATAQGPPTLPGAIAVCPVDPRDRWLRERRKGLGSSDAPVIVLGRMFGRSRHDVFLDKAGIDGDAQDENDEREAGRLRWGHVLEAPMRQELARETKRKVMPAPYLFRSKERHWQQDSPDGFVVRDGEPGCLELKVSSMAAWDEGVPDHVRIQADHHMAVTGLSFCTIAVLRLGYAGIDDLYWTDLERDEARLAALTTVEHTFWDGVQSLDMPEVDGSVECSRALSRIFTDVDAGEGVQLDERFLDLDEELREIKGRQREDDERRRYIEALIKSEIGVNEFGVMPDGTVYTWKQQSRKEAVIPASTFRVVRRKAPKHERT